jgi:spermidine/putrescine-binding protein
MPAQLSRRKFLTRTSAVLGLAAAGCGGRKKRQLRVFVYAGGHEETMRATFVPAFEERTGAEVVLDPGWWDSVPKLEAAPPGKPPFDLVIIDATQGYPAIRAGLFQTLDLGNIPNHRKLAPSVLDHWVYKDGYAIPYLDSVMTLAYRKDAVGFTPARWADLLREEVRGKVALYNSFYLSLYTFACMKVDREGRAGSAWAEVNKDLPGVLKFARAERDRVTFWWPTSTDMVLALARKNAAIGNMHSPEMLQALRERPDLAAVVPDADRAFVQVMWVIPDGTPNKELAEEAIDLIFSEEMQMAFARRGSASGVLSVARKMAAEDPLWKRLYPSTEEQLRSLRYYPYDAYFRDWDHIGRVWDREVLRKKA